MKKIFILLFMMASAYLKSNAQVTITGPTCVVPGTVYQYTITGNWDSTSTMTVCTNGGSIADSADSNACTLQGAPVANVLVNWDTSGSWTLTVTSSAGNAVLNVSVVQPLTPGSIDSLSKTQLIGYDSTPTLIKCSVDTGGSCSPVYSYQWQQSADLVSWTDMQGANSQNLSVDSALTQSKYYRRKVTETVSGSVAYSNAASVFVGITSSWKDFMNKEKLYCIADKNKIK